LERVRGAGRQPRKEEVPGTRPVLGPEDQAGAGYQRKGFARTKNGPDLMVRPADILVVGISGPRG